MVIGVISLCQPWIQLLHTYSVAITLLGLIGFNIAAHIAPPDKKDKFFGAVHVIRELNLTVKDKEFVVLLGPSGC
eukprot:gene13527-17965_t